MDLGPIIKELVQSGGSVVVPGLGRFYTQYRPARIDREKRLLIPPGYIMHFDPETVTDDGGLSKHLVRKHSLPGPDAVKAVSDYAGALEKMLAESGHAVIKGLGRLSETEEGLAFASNPDEGPLEGLLPSIEIPQGKAIQKTSEPAAISPHASSGEHGKVRPASGNDEHAQIRTHEPSTVPAKKKSIMWLPVTLLVLITGLAAILYFTGTFQSMRSDLGHPVASDSSSQENGNRMVFGRPPAGTDTAQEALSLQLDELTTKEKALAYNEPRNAGQIPNTEVATASGQPLNTERGTAASQSSNTERGTAATDAGIEEISRNPAASRIETGSAASGSMAGNYHIIAGSFRVQSNAEKQKVRLEQQGFRASIIKPGDPYYMVSLASFPSLDEAAAALEPLRRQLDIQLWVKKID